MLKVVSSGGKSQVHGIILMFNFSQIHEMMTLHGDFLTYRVVCLLPVLDELLQP